LLAFLFRAETSSSLVLCSALFDFFISNPAVGGVSTCSSVVTKAKIIFCFFLFEQKKCQTQKQTESLVFIKIDLFLISHYWLKIFLKTYKFLTFKKQQELKTYK
jgi:hypothetical protein